MMQSKSEEVYGIVAKVMGVPIDAVSIESSPETIINWDSLRHMKLILAIEESLDVQFSDEELISIKNVGDLLSRVEAKK